MRNRQDSFSDEEYGGLEGTDTNPLLEEGQARVLRPPRSPSRRWLVYAMVLVSMASVVALLVLLVTAGPAMTSTETFSSGPAHSAIGHYKHAAVAADAAQCSTIGKTFLQNPDATVVDAAIGTLLCLGVHSAHSCGIGGGHFMTGYAVPRNGTKKEMFTLDSREVAPLEATEDMFVQDPTLLQRGKKIAVPGELRGYYAAWKKYGNLPWRDLFQPTIKLCRDGYTVDPALGSRIEALAPVVLHDKGLREVFAPEGKLLKTGDKAYRPKLAKTLEKVAEHGPDVLYTGDLSKDLMKDLHDAKSIIKEDDLKQYKPELRQPAKAFIKRKNLYLHTMPPPSGAAILPYMLNIMDGYAWSSKNLTSVDQIITAYQRFTEAMKFASAKKSYLGDPKFWNDDEMLGNLLSNEYATSTRDKITDKETHDVSWYKPAWKPTQDQGTSHLSLLAPDGSAVAATSTINSVFGSGMRGQRTGIIFNNEMDDFDSPDSHKKYGYGPSPGNLIQPGKRPLSSMSPSILLDSNDNVVAVTGASGGTKIPTAVAFVLFHHMWLGMPIGNATDALRLHHTLLPNKLQSKKKKVPTATLS